MSYAIVAFDGEDDDATVDVVPTNWLDKDDRCYWAPYPTAKFIAAVKSRQEPEASWSTYRAKVLKSYGTYSEARVNLRNAENDALSSAHEGHADETVRRKRRTAGINASQRDLGYSEAHERAPVSHSKGTLSQKVLRVPEALQISKCQPQNLPVTETVSGSRKSLLQQPPPASTSVPVETTPTTAIHELLSETPKRPSGVASTVPESISHAPHTPVALTSSAVDASATSSTLIDLLPQTLQTLPASIFNTVEISASAGPELLLQNVQTSPVLPSTSVDKRYAVCELSSQVLQTPQAMTSSTAVTPAMRLQCPSQSGIGVQKSVLEVVLNRLAVLETQQKVHFALLNEILNTIKRSAVVDSSTEPPEELSLPVDSVDDLIELEAKIQSREIRKELIQYLSGHGGNDVRDATRRVLRQVFTTKAALKLNFVGRGDKTGIGPMKITSVVIAAVKRNRQFKDASAAEIEDVIKQWLQGSCDRKGGLPRKNSRHAIRNSHRMNGGNDDDDDDDFGDVE